MTSVGPCKWGTYIVKPCAGPVKQPAAAWPGSVSLCSLGVCTEMLHGASKSAAMTKMMLLAQQIWLSHVAHKGCQSLAQEWWWWAQALQQGPAVWATWDEQECGGGSDL